ncbi:hypothetical protein IFM89_010460, partial [Coptis chinensis]
SLTLYPTFKAIAEDIYKGKAEAMDFGNMGEQVIFEVHKWVQKATNGLINSILPSSLDPHTVILLANSLYFKGNWYNPFDRSYTKDAKFYLLDGDTVEVPFLNCAGGHFATTFDDFKILKLYYEWSYENKDTCISMYIILPNKRDGLWALGEMVGSDPLFMENYLSSCSKLYAGVKKLMLPKFKITTQFEASNVLQDIGLKLPFSKEAEFDEMVRKSDPSDLLYVSKVRHKSVIEVVEEGTEAAGVTEVEMDEYLCDGSDDEPPVPTVEFVADHPFMFVVKNDDNGVILFMGHVVNPILDH